MEWRRGVAHATAWRPRRGARGAGSGGKRGGARRRGRGVAWRGVAWRGGAWRGGGARRRGAATVRRGAAHPCGSVPFCVFITESPACCTVVLPTSSMSCLTACTRHACAVYMQSTCHVPHAMQGMHDELRTTCMPLEHCACRSSTVHGARRTPHHAQAHKPLGLPRPTCLLSWNLLRRQLFVERV